MPLFKRAREVFIPDEMVETENWISDEDLARIFFKIDPTTLLNFELQRKQNGSEDDSIKYDEGVAGKYPDYGSMEAAA
ncbi:hypothetical protein K6K15_04145 [Lacticaseibacillus paracasei]|uniref:hypothetical protein n=1 Tax=Lacticaseibacillus paracasei TaxID=1597 RepID=UPI00272C2CF1|nr:hypothetical protein [Lacticaseibacillus paracasei]WKZ96933.1 hypothetical protein K6K15_04145 [Lacticaseibacillus paracasei]